LLETVILDSHDPTLFIENKLQYLLPVQDPSRLEEFELVPPSVGDTYGDVPPAPDTTLRLRAAPPAKLTLVTYGYMVEQARLAALRLAYEHEIFTELVILTQLAPFAIAPVLDSVQRTGRLLAIEEGTLSLGWGAEILARALEESGSRLEAARRIAALDLPIPASGPLEAEVLPDVNRIVQTAQKMV
jgi:2-oxoisovalerate dehydrogenase E1 component